MQISIYSMESGDNPGSRYVHITSTNITHPIAYNDVQDIVTDIDGVYGVRFPHMLEDSLHISFQVDEPSDIGGVVTALLANGVYKEQRMT